MINSGGFGFARRPGRLHHRAGDHRHPATDLGHLLFKHPDRVQSFPESVGAAHVFHPEAADDRCTAALLLEVDPIGLVRRGKSTRADGFALAPL